ncbi:hypothetical protein DPMN_190506 [Dreissena polymorpha]|uniref:Uncharacterized protein n=1 Tax=Dreissena polymorpha TaxID=45954 RepID=A0A9D4DU00_DREPO|nr:hypothetical protein DPMN_190506 [Dreissena polymorpha]
MPRPRIMKLHRYIDHDWQMTPIDFQVTRTDIHEMYPNKFVQLDENRFRIFNTLYELPIRFLRLEPVSMEEI